MVCPEGVEVLAQARDGAPIVVEGKDVGVQTALEQQIERLRSHLAAQGEALQAEDIFRDESYSGATLNRPGLDRLRDQIKAARITRVVIVSPDRLARNYVHQLVLLEEFAQAGCRVEFLERPMSEDPHDQRRA